LVLGACLRRMSILYDVDPVSRLRDVRRPTLRRGHLNAP